MTTFYKIMGAMAVTAFVLAASAQATAPKAKVSPTQAEAAATHKIPGKALSAKYEYEDGRWQYAVLVKSAKGLYEVEVSSTTGKVLDSEKTSMAEEASEARADARAAHH